MGDMLESLPMLYRGKGKDMREIPGHPDLLLQVCRDTLSTHNVVHETLIAGKGAVVAAQTLFMRSAALSFLSTHIKTYGQNIYSYLPKGAYPPDLHHRAFIVNRARTPDVEMVFRRYNVGSLAKALRENGKDPYGLRLSADLPLMHRFDSLAFTPTQKSATDDPLDARCVMSEHSNGYSTAKEAFMRAEAYLAGKGIALIDAKFELDGGILIDDWLNGDCARMALKESIRIGEEPGFLDKERFRRIAVRKWGGGPKVPLAFSEEEVREGLAGYHEAFELITDMTLGAFQKQYLNV